MSSGKPLVLILCGGRSLRLWPLSQYKSKNFLDIFGFSPLELTIKRFLKVTPAENIFLVANHKERATLNRIKLVKKKNIFFEPESKNTAAAILLSLLHLSKYSKKNLIISPVDSLIQREKEFYRALNKALRVAAAGGVCTLGLKPLTPSPSFGYIQVNPRGYKGIFSVKRFLEKPKPSLAAKLIKRGNCFYNSGMFVAAVGTLLAEYQKYYPVYHDFRRSFHNNRIATLYKRIKDIPFDKAIMEKTNRAKLIKGDFFWKDFGSWLAIYEVLSKDKKRNVKKGTAAIYNAKDNLIYLDDSRKKVLVMGLSDVFLIDTKHYVLLTHRNCLDSLKLALKKFKHAL